MDSDLAASTPMPDRRPHPATLAQRRRRAARLCCGASLSPCVWRRSPRSASRLSISPALVWSALLANPADLASDASLQQARAVLLDIRLPRVLLALLVGAGFGSAGSALQALFRDPLADPGLIGISSGAALGAATLIVLGPVIGAVSLGWLPVAAFIGALLVATLVYRLAAARGRLALPLLLLAGIAINALAGAAIGLLTYLADDAQLRSLTFWSLGSLGGAPVARARRGRAIRADRRRADRAQRPCTERAATRRSRSAASRRTGSGESSALCWWRRPWVWARWCRAPASSVSSASWRRIACGSPAAPTSAS